MPFETSLTLGGGWVAMAIVMALLWLLQRRTGDAGVVDVGWSAGVGLLGVALAITGEGDPWRRLILGLGAAAWGLRLALYLLVDRILRGDEDGRYVALREAWGERTQRNLFWFYQAQALSIPFFALPFAAVAVNVSRPLGVLDALGVVIFLVALAGESIADRQLAAFRSDPTNRGKTCRIGLWRYSRHPNYFFEWVHWFAYIALAWGSSIWWLSLSGPIVMLLFLYRVTGIPYTEMQALRSRGDDYRDYQKTTSAFVPWFPQEDAS